MGTIAVFLLLGGTAYVTMPRENFPDHDGDSVPTHVEDLDGDNYFDEDTDMQLLE